MTDADRSHLSFDRFAAAHSYMQEDLSPYHAL